MAATPANIDSGLSGQPSNDIDKQKGPATGSNAESAGSSLNAGAKPVHNPAEQKSGGASEHTGGTNQQQGSGGGSH